MPYFGMDTIGESSIEFLAEHECRGLLTHERMGRLAVSVHDQPEIFPVNYVFDNDRILIHTTPGSKLVELTINHNVAFEIDRVTDDVAWSVVVKGPARVLDRRAEIDAAAALPLRPIAPTLKSAYVEIRAEQITGRRFPLSTEPGDPEPSNPEPGEPPM